MEMKGTVKMDDIRTVNSAIEVLKSYVFNTISTAFCLDKPRFGQGMGQFRVKFLKNLSHKVS